MTEDDSYLVCPKCGERLSTWSRAGKIKVSCESCDYVGFEIVGLTQRFLRQFTTQQGTVYVGEIKREEA